MSIETIAVSLGMEPDKLTAEIKRSLPSLIEQAFYVKLGPAGIKPNTFRRMIQEILGRELTQEDIERRPTDHENVFLGTLDDVTHLVEKILSLIADGELSAKRATALAVTLRESTDALLQDIADNGFGILGRIDGGKRVKEDRMVSYLVGYYLDTVRPKCEAEGRVCPATLSEYFRLDL